MFKCIFRAAFKFGNFLRREFIVESVAQLLEDFTLFFKRKPVELFQNLGLGRTHGGNLLL